MGRNMREEDKRRVQQTSFQIGDEPTCNEAINKLYLFSIASTISWNSLADGVFLYRPNIPSPSCPPSNTDTSSVSTGSVPKNRSSSLRAISAPPPVENTLLISPQQGHTYPLMFSIRPSTGRLTARVNDRHFIASIRATACGVVTITAESRECTPARCSMRERCSSDVPAGLGVS